MVERPQLRTIGTHCPRRARHRTRPPARPAGPQITLIKSDHQGDREGVWLANDGPYDYASVRFAIVEIEGTQRAPIQGLLVDGIATMEGDLGPVESGARRFLPFIGLTPSRVGPCAFASPARTRTASGRSYANSRCYHPHLSPDADHPSRGNRFLASRGPWTCDRAALMAADDAAEAPPQRSGRQAGYPGKLEFGVADQRLRRAGTSRSRRPCRGLVLCPTSASLELRLGPGIVRWGR